MFTSIGALNLSELLDRFLFANSAESISDIALTVIVGLLLGLITSFIYKLTTQRLLFSFEYALTITIVAGVISLVVSVTGTNLARSFSLAGALSIIRFRSIAQSPRDIAYLFISMGAGFASGAGLFVPALLFVLLLGVAMCIYAELKKASKSEVKLIRVCVPENRSFDGIFDEVLKKYTKEFSLSGVRLIDGGTAYELSYMVCLKDMGQVRELLDELRLRNANFSVSCMTPPLEQNL